MRDWTIFKGIASKGGGWVLLQGELEVDGRGGSTFSLVGVDIFATTYLIYGPFTYKFFMILSSNMYLFGLFLQLFTIHDVSLGMHRGNVTNILLVISRWGSTKFPNYCAGSCLFRWGLPFGKIVGGCVF